MQLLHLSNENEYYEHFVEKYCKVEKYTCENIRVKFYEDQFYHAFYESKDRKKRDKSVFSIERAERMDWIEQVLMNKNVEKYVGWDRDKKRYNYNRRVSIITKENYVVILNIINKKEAKFITAYVASKTNAIKIRKAPIWDENKNTTDYWFSSGNL